MNGLLFKTMLDNEANLLQGNVRDEDTIVNIIRNGKVICCT